MLLLYNYVLDVRAPGRKKTLYIFIKFSVIEENVKKMRILCEESPGQTNIIIWLAVARTSTWGPYIEV